MPHALTMNRTIVPPPDRDRFFARARALRTHFQSRGCQYWVFEDADIAGAFVEFAEGSDAATLSDAYASAPVEPLPLGQERDAVELDPTDQPRAAHSAASRRTGHSAAWPLRPNIYREVTL